MITSAKADLKRYLATAREALLWKLDGLSEYDARRPLTPTGTNLLGLVKHLAATEVGYFAYTFDRPFPEPIPWFAEDAEYNADLWATPDESREYLVGHYERACAHSDTVVDSLDLDAVGQVRWWPEGSRDVTLHRVLVHMTAETQRHAGHADIVRELIDGTAGMRPDNDNLPPVDEKWWREYRERVEEAARAAERPS